jgi:hypothetical protein
VVHVGQSSQPRPDDDSRTASPVTMITALEITAASAHPRTAPSVGRQNEFHTRITPTRITPACLPRSLTTVLLAPPPPRQPPRSKLPPTRPR